MCIFLHSGAKVYTFEESRRLPCRTFNETCVNWTVRFFYYLGKTELDRVVLLAVVMFVRFYVVKLDHSEQL